MDNSDSDQSERRNSTNTEYVPTKCRVTKPPPPKPATNPLQFIRVAPCPLLVKAKEQIKKVEEIKKERKDVREEAEDWQSKLDNWKSCRRKRQEHIIERVVEVKKIEQEESERSRRKAKTFNEMMQERGRGRHKFPIPVYDDDSNDLSDLGLGAASTSESTVKHTETDSYDSTEHNHTPSTENNHITNGNNSNNEHVFKKPPEAPPKKEIRPILKTRVSIRDESLIFANQEQEISKSKELNEAQTVLPKGEIFKRKELFNKPLEINTYESNSARRLSEDFCNAQSIKQRLQNLEKVTENPNKNDNDKVQVLSIKERLSNFNKLNDSSDSRNNNDTQQKPNKISDYLLKSTIAKNNNQYNNDWKKDERSSSPETVFMNKLNMFDRELDTMMYGKCASDNGLEDSYAPSTSSTEVMALSSDREDSGIHTADVSCSVSQADEPMEDELASNTIPICIEQQDYETPKISPNAPNVVGYLTKDDIINSTMEFLESVRRSASENSDVYQSPLTNHNQINQQLNEWDSGTMVEDTLTMNVQLQNTQPLATYENKRNLTLDFSNDFVVDPLSPSNMVEPPKVKPPPPPPSEDEEPLKRLNSTKRFKKKLHIKRSSFLGLESPTDDQINPELIMDKPPDINTFLQMEKTMFRKTHDGLSKVESQDSGLDIDRERLSGETWDNSHTRHDSEQTNSVASEDEVSKKEREIIELVEKEEQSQSRDPHADYTHRQNNVATLNNHNLMQFEPSLGSEKFQSPYFPPTSDFLDDQDSEVLKVEQELRQLEREELERQRENMLFRESRAKAQLKNNRHSMESIIDEIYPTYHPEDVNNYRKSMPELQHIPLDYRRSNEMVTYPDIYGGPELDLEMHYRKSMPNIHGYPAVSEVHKSSEELRAPGYRKSMPELQKEPHRSFAPAPPVRQAIPTGKPLKRYSPKQDNKPRMLTKPSMQALSAIPRNKYIQNDKWLQPRQNPEVKSYNQHWLYQEAELRRIQDQQKNLSSRNWPPQHHRHEKHLPDAIINTLTERVQSRLLLNDRNQPMLIRPDASSTREFNQNSYLDHSQTLGHALPMSYQTPAQFEDAQDRILSVSGKKKCSYCGNELGRGAAMIIESLCLFYHMECFKCCVCHMQLGDGLMGTDVRVRNQKLHCHNCYSSDDGVKFSCV